MTPEQAELFSRWLETQKDRWATRSTNAVIMSEEFNRWQAMKLGDYTLPDVAQDAVQEVWKRRNNAKGMK